MIRRTCMALGLATGAVALSGAGRYGSARAADRWLISPEERLASQKAGAGTMGATTRTAATDPAVEIVSPTEGGKIVSPVDFYVRFRPTPPATIDPASIRILYGYLLIDITRRIVEFGGSITAEGITLPKAPLQPDNYRVTIEVADSLKHRTRRTVSFRVD